MTVHHKAALGRCGFLDVLEEAALRRRRVVLGLADGSEFDGRIVDVVTGAGADWIVLADRPRVDVEIVLWLGFDASTAR